MDDTSNPATTEKRSLSDMLSDFIGIVAHNIHTPVGAIKWSAETLLKGEVGPVTDQQREIIQDIYTCADRLNDLSRTILYVYELEKDMPLLKQRDITLQEILVRVQGSLTSLCKRRGSSILAAEKEYAVTAYTDPDIAFMILRILTENALSYSPEQSEVRIHASQEDRGTTFTVEDHGIGIDSDNRAFIFRKFFRTPAARRMWTDGVGLNLYIAYNLATRMGGELTFESAEGKGSTFSWFIPVHKRRREPWEVF